MNTKVFILLPDGVGLRNFAYSSFHKIGLLEGFDIVFWNNTPFNLSELGFQEIKIENAKTHPFTNVYKTAKIRAELNVNIKKTKDSLYESYWFGLPKINIKTRLTSIAVQLLSGLYSSRRGLTKLRMKMNSNERKTPYYSRCLETLKRENPAVVFCTNQRSVLAITPLIAAKDLGIPTATFIFSWDNLPKATMVVETDYYFVWSNHMKKEIQFYYPNITSEQIFVTGTPQFEYHFDKSKLLSRELFFEQHGLNLNRKYICYSGDDITTSPDDPQYLEDLALAVRELNKKGNSLGVIFRRCPVDFSSRFDEVLEKHKDIIVPIIPSWEKIGIMWNTIFPTPNDISLQMNTIAHTEMVVNLGSSMVFDYASHNKPCCYINYDVQDKVDLNWSAKKIYKFIHFRSMTSEKAVIWINSSEEMADKIEKGLHDATVNISLAKDWFEVINQHPPEGASGRIWQGIKKIVK